MEKTLDGMLTSVNADITEVIELQILMDTFAGECICRLQAKPKFIWVKVRFTTVIREYTHIYSCSFLQYYRGTRPLLIQK